MTQLDRLGISQNQMIDFCQRWKIRELAFFGSILRPDFGPDSDVDVLVTFEDRAGWTLLDLVTIRDELQTLIGRRVDLLTRSAVERSRNPVRQRSILNTAQTVYVA